MGGKIVFVPQSAHECSDLPPTSMLKRGTHWQCDECNQTWVLVSGLQYNEHYEAWRKLTTRNIDGREL